MLTKWNDFSRMFTALEEFQRRSNLSAAESETPHVLHQKNILSGRSGPRLNLYDDGKKLVLDAEVPGLAENDIKLSINQNVLSISGERKLTEPDGYAVHRQERSSYNFVRSVSLPCQVDTDKVMAHIENGLLTVTLEKSKEAQPRQITIKAS